MSDTKPRVRIDADGYVQSVDSNPVTTRVKLEHLQTGEAKVAHLHGEYANHPSRGLTPKKLAGIMLRAEQGDLVAQCELAADIEEKDAHIFSELQKRKTAALSVPWTIKPPRDATKQEIEDTLIVQQLIEDMGCFEDIMLNMGDALLKGYSNQELNWQRIDGFHTPQVIHREPSWFKLHPDDRNQLRLRDNSNEGAELIKFGWISHTHRAKSGYLGTTGLVRVLAWPFLFKNYSVRDLAEFLEIYGLPLRLGKYPGGATPKEKNTLLRAVMGIGHNSAAIIPKGMDIEFEEAAKGAAGPFEAMISWAERSVSKAILGGTLTSQADGKSSTNALGNVHNECRFELRDGDLRQYAATLNRDLILPLYALNCKSYRNYRRLPKLEFDTQAPEDINLLSEAFPKLVGIGFKIPQEWAHNKLQIPFPKDDEAVLGVATQPEVKPKASLKQSIAVLKGLSNRESAFGTDKDVADDYSKQLSKELAPLLAGYTDEIQQLVDGASSLDDLQQKLNALDLSTGEATEVLQRALVASELAGQYEVSEGN
ncbi:MAG: DUF935 domain-containing protein [Gammaproteobacteria bacterium]|nr:DUF935 domain-containing protein [Psychrosphaera sp.]NRA56251.1 DUF935 domain-containing protein [Gammaproteobacteria bacterium]